MNKKKVLLDRFIYSSLPYFYDHFKETDFDVRTITYNGNLPSDLKDYSGELLNDFDISRGSYFLDTPWVLDSKDLEFFSNYEGLFHDVLSRFALSPSYWASHEISVHATSLLNFWKHKLATEKIDVCFAFYTPHEPSSFSLYLVTKLLKIPYIFIDMPIIGQKIRFMSCSFKYRNLLIHKKIDQTPDWAKEILENYQSKIIKNFKSSLPPIMYAREHNFNKVKFIKKIILAFKNGDFLKKVFDKLPRASSYLKYNRSEWYSAKAVPNRIIFNFKKFKIMRNISKKSYDYKKICSLFGNELKNKNYIYFGAPMSPEGSFIPTALWNRHSKILILKLLSVIPDDWKILYKANPHQFSKNKRYIFSTFPDWYTSDFYNDLLKTKKVLFVSTDTPTKELIENSRGVASINGTVSSEAVALGKNAIIFSPMWYDELEGVHFCNTQNDLKEVIDLMKNNHKPSPKFSKLHLSSESIFDGGDFINGNFSKNVYKTISSKFISSYRVFDDLDEKKWSI